MQPVTSLVAAFALAQIALQRAKSTNTAPPPLMLSAAVTSCRASCSRPPPLTHSASSAECPWFTSTSVIGPPHTVTPPTPARVFCVMVGWFL